MTVWQFAELSDSWSSRVSLLFRNGMCSSDEPPLASLEITWKEKVAEALVSPSRSQVQGIIRMQDAVLMVQGLWGTPLRECRGSC